MNQILLALSLRLGDTSRFLQLFHTKTGLVLTSLALGLLGTLGFAPFNFWILLLASLAFEFCLVASLQTKKQVFWTLLCYFTALHASTLEWLNAVMSGFGEIPLFFSWCVEILFSAYLGIFHAFLGTLAFALCHRKLHLHLSSSSRPKATSDLQLAEKESQEEDEDDEDYDDSDALPERSLATADPALPTPECQEVTHFYKNAFLLCFLPLALITADALVGWCFTGFPWLYVGYSVMDGPFTGYAPLLGVRGLSLVFFICAGAVSLTIMRRYVYLPVAALLFLFGLFVQNIQYVDELKPLSVAGIQGNITQAVKWNPKETEPTITKYLELSEPYFGKVDLIVWPESALPLYTDQAAPLLDRINMYSYARNTSFITGIQHIEMKTDMLEPRYYNSMLLLGQEEHFTTEHRYDKRQLVPFGEVVPFRDVMKHFGKIFNFPMSSFDHGANEQQQLRLEKKQLSFIPVICYESIFPEMLLSMHDENTNGIIMVSNDSWFANTRAPQQHLNIARMRVMETQKPMLRMTNSGISALIDRTGAVQTSVPENEVAVLEGKLTPTKGMTPFARWGNLPLLILMLIVGIAGLSFRSQDLDLQNLQLKELVRP